MTIRRAACAPKWLAVLAVAASGLASALSAAQTAAAAAPPEPRQPVLETPWFRFHSDFDFNLYDAVLTSATARLRDKPDPFHGECFAKLVQEERSAWDAAVGYYAQTVASTEDFSRERFVVRSKLAHFAPELDDDDHRDLALSLLFLDAASRAYRACGWTDQDATNRRWIAELNGRLERHADAIGRRLEEVYATKWRHLPIDVDVVATAGWSGADTIAFPSVPTHTQISSRNPGYQGPNALEMIFHEASHELMSPNNGPTAQLLAAVAAEAGVGVDRNLWHALLFITAGDLARSAIEKAGEGPYVPVAEEVLHRAWEPFYQPLVTHWLPYVRGKGERRKAALDLVVAIATPK
jgi:hypothetical protein